MPFLHLLFLVPLAQNSQYAKTVCFGVANSNPPQLLMVGLFAVSEGPRSLNSALQTVCPHVPVAIVYGAAVGGPASWGRVDFPRRCVGSLPSKY